MRRLTILLLLLLCLQASGAPASEWEVILSGTRKWELLRQDLERATESICLEYFSFAPDSSGRLIGDLLKRKAEEGVAVKLIMENVIGGFTPRDYYDQMAASGVEIRYFTNPRDWPVEINYRDHRKIVVIDDHIGYVGGMNLARRYHLDWRDTHLRFTGPAVTDLKQVFCATWEELNGAKPAPQDAEKAEGPLEIVSGSPFYPVFLKKYVQLLEDARYYVYLQTPYFCPPDDLMDALKKAAARGVDVRLVVPKKTDHPTTTAINRSFFQELLEGGIRVYEYLPRFNHSKVAVADDRYFWVGSVNLDYRSFLLDYEICACITDPETAIAQKAVYLDLLEESEEVTQKEVAAWSPWRRFLYGIPRLIKRQL